MVLEGIRMREAEARPRGRPDQAWYQDCSGIAEEWWLVMSHWRPSHL